jgi:ABC-type amino acid transport substrate-binding protein
MVVQEFLKTNPGALRQVQPDKPLRVFGNALAVKKGEIELRDFFDVALEELLNDGSIGKILAKYDATGSSFYPIALPYRMPKGK